MGYESDTDYLIWVSLYTQKVNVFSGKKGEWKLEQSYDCSSGKNETPTIVGSYKIQGQDERWDLGSTYVAPVLVFNGGAAFTSQPYYTEDGELADDTIGAPASGGSIRLQARDIAWVSENIPDGTTVIIY